MPLKAPMPDFSLHKQLETDSILIRNLALSQLRLQNQKAVPWLILVPRRTGVTEIHQLSAEDRAMLMEEIAQASRAIEKLYAPDKINIASLGNVVPQLHVHVIARFTKDPAWPAPIWGKFAPEPYALPALAEIKKKFNDDRLWA
jgi:diadenosine tetraphosphate (Ap4A) HIT family hydrolase